jgi:transmembrane sensor
MALIEKDNSAMHILLARYLSRETDANETAMVEKWIVENANNKKYVDQLQVIWNESKKLANNQKPDAQKALQDFQERIKAAPTGSVYKMRWLQVAAIFLVIAGVATIIKLTNHSQTKSPEFLKFVAGNIVQTDTLPDGSVVQLQPHAELICPVRFVTYQRNVQLKGDAYFSVLHNANHPFQISVNNVKVTVLGTSFKILNVDSNTEVDVITGVVQVTKDERSVKVFPHEKLMVPASNDMWIKQKDTLPDIPLPQKITHKPSQVKPATTTTADSSIDDYTYHRQAMLSILNDLIKEGLATDRKSIVWAALTDSVLILDGKTQPETLHQKLKVKYHITEEGYYYGSVQITGKGYFFNVDDFK